MKKFVCPSCGGELSFQSNISVFAICPFCKSMIVRRDLDVQAVGKMAILPEDPTPIQIGAGGVYNQIHFSVVGRVRQTWDGGYWNEWFMNFDNGQQGWLAEAQGFYAVSFETNEISAPPIDKLVVGERLRLGKSSFEIEGIMTIICGGSEGELPFRGIQGRKSTSVDLTGENSDFASLDYSDEGPAVYLGQYVEFETLNFSGLKQLEGWQ